MRWLLFFIDFYSSSYPFSSIFYMWISERSSYDFLQVEALLEWCDRFEFSELLLFLSSLASFPSLTNSRPSSGGTCFSLIISSENLFERFEWIEDFSDRLEKVFPFGVIFTDSWGSICSSISAILSFDYWRELSSLESKMFWLRIKLPLFPWAN